MTTAKAPEPLSLSDEYAHLLHHDALRCGNNRGFLSSVRGGRV
jgi:hypothetical protein